MSRELGGWLVVDSGLHVKSLVNRLQFLRLVKLVIAVTLLGVVGAELFARFYLGLGTPPLTIPDPTIEYLFAPNQHVKRFGNRFSTNAFSMRSLPFTERRLAGERRVLVFGDSVVNGGSLTDQAKLATSRVQRMLSHRGAAVVGNVSAGSWGPPNHLAYINKFGLFDANIAIFVYSSHDYFDLPSFEPLNPLTHPTTRPLLAIDEGFRRYLPRYFPSRFQPDKIVESDGRDRIVGANAEAELHRIFDLVGSSNSLVHCVLWPDREEALGGQRKPGFAEIHRIAIDHGVPVTDVGEKLIGLDENAVYALYRDRIHPTDSGQQLLAEILFEVISSSLQHD